MDEYLIFNNKNDLCQSVSERLSGSTCQLDPKTTGSSQLCKKADLLGEYSSDGKLRLRFEGLSDTNKEVSPAEGRSPAASGLIETQSTDESPAHCGSTVPEVGRKV